MRNNKYTIHITGPYRTSKMYEGVCKVLNIEPDYKVPLPSKFLGPNINQLVYGNDIVITYIIYEH